MADISIHAPDSVTNMSGPGSSNAFATLLDSTLFACLLFRHYVIIYVLNFTFYLVRSLCLHNVYYWSAVKFNINKTHYASNSAQM